MSGVGATSSASLTRAWERSFESLERSLELTDGFSLLPVQVGSPELAGVLAEWFRARGLRTELVAPEGPDQWRTLASRLAALPAETERVLVVAGSDQIDAARDGLLAFNRSRDVVRDRLRCPLLWCGTLDFHEATMTSAPDLWSVRELTVRLTTPLVPATAAHDVVVDPDTLAAARDAVRRGGCADPSAWRTLGLDLLQRGEVRDGCLCLETALCLGDDRDEALLERIVRARIIDDSASWTLEGALDRAERGIASAEEVREAITRFVAQAWRGAVSEPLRRQALRVVEEGGVGVSFALWWLAEQAARDELPTASWEVDAHELAARKLRLSALDDRLDLPATLLPEGRTQRSAALDRLWEIAARLDAPEGGTQRAYLQLQFAIGFAMLGEEARGQALLDALAPEEDAHEEPNRMLFALYRRRFVHAASRVDLGTWRRDSESVVATIREPNVRDRVDWIRERSEWLRPAVPDDQGTVTKPAVERAIAEAEARPELAPVTLAQLADDRTLFDFEVRVVIERLLRAVIRRGDRTLLAHTLHVATQRIERITLGGHRAGAIRACLDAATALGDVDTLDNMLEAVLQLENARETPSTRDLLLAAIPAIDALWQMGATSSTRRMLDSLELHARGVHRERIKLRAYVADGYLLLGDEPLASYLLDQCVADTLEGGLDHVGRFDACVAVLVALRHWPMVQREQRCSRVVGALDRFADTFTASLTGLYATLQILLGERIVDCIVAPDEGTRAWLDEHRRVLLQRLSRVRATA